ncbi:MAG: hypothetical protein LBT84_05985 [Spirochaetia bacterium]|jgi:hypothetical protein|nr:hypothetical protein [Spirochaetia bacterium]
MTNKKKFRKPSQRKGKNVKDRVTEVNTTSIEYPVFGFKYINKELHPDKIDPENQKALLNQLCKLSELTWNQIISAPRHGLGTEDVRQEDLNFSLPAHIANDVRIIALRYSGKLAMVGYRSNGNVFHILGVDMDFNRSCYKHD